jgi:hypothetical protein
METAWAWHGLGMGTACAQHGHGMGTAWARHGHSMGTIHRPNSSLYENFIGATGFILDS